MKEPLVTIIIPVYNAEKTLKRCVDSVLKQSWEKFELFLVDDGSTDGSAALCDVYQRQDARVHVIHKQNTGVSDSRNRAMKLAQGVYLQFLDSDDWISPEAIACMVRAAEANVCDLVVTDFYRVVGDLVSRKGDIEDTHVMTREEFAAHMMKNPADFYYGVLWNKLYRREIIKAWHLQMDTQISWCEDFMFNLEYMRRAERFYALQVPVYYYVRTKGSLASQSMNLLKAIRMKSMVFAYYDRFFREALDEAEYEKSRLQIYRFLIDASGDGSVLPLMFPGTKRLGDERISVSMEMLDGNGAMAELYRLRKLFEHSCALISEKYDLKTEEIMLLYCIAQRQQYRSRKELADILGVSRSRLAALIQRLMLRELILTEETRPGIRRNGRENAGENALSIRREMAAANLNSGAETSEAGAAGEIAKEDRALRFAILPGAEDLLHDIAEIQSSFDRIRFSGFSEDELIQYAKLENKMRGNIRRALER